MWEEYFPNAEIYGIDIHDQVQFENKNRIHFRLGDQADGEFLRKVSDEVRQWDIVLDDGSHEAKDQIISFETLWPRVRPGGLYAIEDVGHHHTLSYPCSAYFQGLVNHKFTFRSFKMNLTKTFTDIGCITFYPELIIIEKNYEVI